MSWDYFIPPRFFNCVLGNINISKSLCQKKGAGIACFYAFFIVTVTFSLQDVVNECVSVMTLKVLIVTHRHLCFFFILFFIADAMLPDAEA